MTTLNMRSGLRLYLLIHIMWPSQESSLDQGATDPDAVMFLFCSEKLARITSWLAHPQPSDARRCRCPPRHRRATLRLRAPRHPAPRPMAPRSPLRPPPAADRKIHV